MIKNDVQLAWTRKQLARFKALNQRKPTGSVPPVVAKAAREGRQTIIDQLTQQIKEYEALKAGKMPKIPELTDLSQIGPYLAKVRIARGMTQQQLAKQLGITQQAISKLEEMEYQTITLQQLKCILDVLELKPTLTLARRRVA
jgi:DNA-binding Xre family transcriptional regulator